MKAIECKGITKLYGAVTALNGVDLQVEEGELFGLLGVNGAGKTTLIKILSGLTKPSEGDAFLFGKSVLSEMQEIKPIVSVSPQETSVALNLTVKENLEFFAAIYYKDAKVGERAVEEIIHTLSLEEVLKRRAKTLSGGWQRRLSIAAAIVSSPKILFLDEPTLGLDVLARRELWNVINKIKSKTTIVLTSHYLEEVEALCDRVAVMDKGKVKMSGSCGEIKRATGCDNFEDAFVTAVTDGERN